MKVETIWTVMGSILHIEVSYPHPDTSTMIITAVTVRTVHTTVYLYCSSIAIWYPVVSGMGDIGIVPSYFFTWIASVSFVCGTNWISRACILWVKTSVPKTHNNGAYVRDTCELCVECGPVLNF